MEIKFKIKL